MLQRIDTYTFKHFDTDVFKFKLIQEEGLHVELIELMDESLLPLGTKFSENSIKNWLLDRVIDERRYNSYALLAALNLSFEDKKSLIDYSKCLSLMDPFWVKREDDRGTYETYNFYNRPLIRKLSNISFDKGDTYQLKKFNASPEFTTKIDFRTCWIKEKGEIFFVKSNKDENLEHLMKLHSEVLVKEIADCLDIKCVESKLFLYRKRLSCKQSLLTNKEIGYVRASKLVPIPDLKSVFAFCEQQGEDVVYDLKNMLFLDVITCNKRRTLDNFGFLLDNYKNKIIGFAPLFQNGKSLFFDEEKIDVKNYSQYENRRKPVLCDSLLEMYQDYLLNHGDSKLDKLKTFKFKRKKKYSMWNSRLLDIEEYLQKRILELKKISSKRKSQL